jgi:hypothetical protein
MMQLSFQEADEEKEEKREREKEREREGRETWGCSRSYEGFTLPSSLLPYLPCACWRDIAQATQLRQLCEIF